MTDTWITIQYSDMLNGGSGMTGMLLSDLPMWLAERPGTVIREIDQGGIDYSHRLRSVRKEAIIKLTRNI